MIDDEKVRNLIDAKVNPELEAIRELIKQLAHQKVEPVNVKPAKFD